MDAEVVRLVHEWLEQDAAGWASGDLSAYAEIDRLVRERPEEAWNVVLELVVQAPSERALFSVAAGPLEDLLVKHGDFLIDRVEKEANANPQLLRCLSGVWGNQLSSAVSKRLRQIIKPLAGGGGGPT
jgi:hypothetical protein